MKFSNIFKFSRFSFIFVGIILLLVGGIALGTIQRNSYQISNLLAERGLSFLEVVERIVYSSVRENRPFEINNLVDELIKVRDFRFAMLVDENDNILLHTNHEQIGKKFDYELIRHGDSGTIILPGEEIATWEEVSINGLKTHITLMDFNVPKPIRRNMHRSHMRDRDDYSNGPTSFFPHANSNDSQNLQERREEFEDRFVPSMLSPTAQLFFENIQNAQTITAIVGQDISLHKNAKRQADLVVFAIALGVAVTVITTIAVLQYITRNEEEKKRQADKINAISDLTAGVAHEIRNPLSSIKGYATFFKQKFEKGSSEEVAASIMVEEVDRLNRAIDDLVGLGRTFVVDLEPVNIVEICSKLCHLLEPDFQEKNVELKCLFDKTKIITVQADTDKIRQAILNLILNAIESFEKDDIDKKVYLELVEKNKQVLISIIDNGSGIKKDIISRIYDPYFTTKAQGTGLGLVMVKSIIEAHKGVLDISSPSTLADPRFISRQGTEVTISLNTE